MRATAIALLLGAVGLGAAALDPVEIKEWPVPWPNTRPRDPYPDAQGRIWFVGQTGDYLAVLDPRSGEFKRFELDGGTGPHNLIVDAKGMVWYAGNRTGHIGRLDPATGQITKIPMPDPAARDPHTLVFGQDGEIWFTAQVTNFVGRLVPATGEVKLVPVPTPNARPYGIVTDSKGRAWVALFGTNKLALLDRELKLREVALPEGTRPRRLVVTSDDRVWYVDYARGLLGRLDPKSGKVSEWPAPGAGGARPYAMTVDDRDRIWFVETGPKPNRLVGFDPKRGEFFSVTDIPSGAGSVRHMVFHRPSRTTWFGTDANTIGRAVLPK